MGKRRYFLRGVYIACGVFLCVAIALVVQAGLLYDGKCGAIFPALAGPKPCSFLDFVVGNVLWIGLVLGVVYWPLFLALLGLPPFVGYLIDRRAQNHAA